jgi:hypothetical protein
MADQFAPGQVRMWWDPRQGMRSAVDLYQRMIGQPAAQLIGGGVRGMLGLDVPDYGGALGQEAYRTGQAISVMPMVAAPVGLARGIAKVPITAERLLKEQKYYGRPMQNASEGILTYMPPEKFLSLTTAGTDVQERAAKLKSFDVEKFNADYLPYLDISFGGRKPSQVLSHEGRARATRAMMDGVEQIPVVIRSRGQLFRAVDDLPNQITKEKSRLKIDMTDAEKVDLLMKKD